MAQSSPAPVVVQKMWTVPELVAVTGVSKTQIHRHIEAGELGYVEMGTKSRSAPRIPNNVAEAFFGNRFIPARRTA